MYFVYRQRENVIESVVLCYSERDRLQRERMICRVYKQRENVIERMMYCVYRMRENAIGGVMYFVYRQSECYRDSDVLCL